MKGNEITEMLKNINKSESQEEKGRGKGMVGRRM